MEWFDETRGKFMSAKSAQQSRKDTMKMKRKVRRVSKRRNKITASSLRVIDNDPPTTLF